jgi:hypothetical protein
VTSLVIGATRPAQAAIPPEGGMKTPRDEIALVQRPDLPFRDMMLKLIGSPNLAYKQLTAKVQDAA